MSNKLIIVSKWIERVDDKLTLTSEGIASLTEDLEYIVDKYTGIDDASFMKCGEIRTDVIELIHSIINREVANGK